MKKIYSQERLTLSCGDDYTFDVWELPLLPRHCQTRESYKFISLADGKYQVSAEK